MLLIASKHLLSLRRPPFETPLAAAPDRAAVSKAAPPSSVQGPLSTEMTD
jgi:hypothetical protein